MKRMRSERSMDRIQEEIDMISDLPDHMIHRIVSSLPTKDVARTSLLSKRFRSAWYSYPFLDFDSTYTRTWEGAAGKNHFFTYMQNCIRRRADDFGLFKFRLNVDAKVRSVGAVDEAIAYAIENRVRELDVSFLTPSQHSASYRLPSAVFSAVFSANSLTVLKLNGFDLRRLDHVKFPVIEELILRDCVMGNLLSVSSNRLKTVELLDCAGLSDVDICSSNLTSFSYQRNQSSGRCEINLKGCCKSLENLILKNVGITSEFLEDQVSKLLVLENLKLHSCDKLDDELCITSPSLKTLEIFYSSALKKIEVRAVNLESFVYEANSRSRDCDINIVACKFLKVLELSYLYLSDRWFERTVSMLRFLDHLKLYGCRLLASFLVHHQALRCLELIDCANLKDVQFHGRNLTSFKYAGNVLRPNFFIDSPELKAYLTLYSQDNWYNDLRDFLGLFDHCKSLSIKCQWKYLIIPKDLREDLLPPLYDMKHIEIVSDAGPMMLDNLTEVVDSLLWLSPLLETITFASRFDNPKKFLQLEYEKTVALGEEEEEDILVEEEDKNCWQCQSLILKCWRHFVKKVSMKNFNDSDQRKLRKYFRQEAIRLDSITPPGF